MSIRSALRNVFGSAVDGSAYNYRSQVAARIDPVELPAQAIYSLLRAAYLSNGFYQDAAGAHISLGSATPQMRAIRNPIAPVVDFFGAKTFPNPLTVKTENEAIIQPIEQVWRWSNWQRKRYEYARYLALFGEAYTKTVADRERGRVYFEVISPEYVTDFSIDERDYLTMIRLDIPLVERDETGTRRFTHTELWVKAAESTSEDEPAPQYRRWRTEGDASNRNVRDLGQPAETLPLSAFGIDFVPFTRSTFKEIGEPRGVGAVQLALEAIVDADLSATNLHSVIFQDLEGAVVLKSVGVDANGRPLPPPRVNSSQPVFDAQGRQVNGPGQADDASIVLGKRAFLRLPGNQEFEYAVPPINYEAALLILKDHDEHLERLMPALAYARISELSGSDLSGRAIRFKLTPAIDQVLEVRESALAALTQANQQALTMAVAAGIPGFDGLGGTFESGAFDHTFVDTEIIAVGDYEAAQTQREQAQAFQTWTGATLPMSEGLLRAGYTEEEAERITNLAADEADEAMERQMALMEQRGATDEDDGEDAA